MIDRALLGLEGLFTHRATVERKAAADTGDAYGARRTLDWAPLAVIDCFAWLGTGAVATRIGGPQVRPEGTVDLNAGGLVCPEGTDITARDRITDLVDENGREVAPGPLEILAVAQFEGLTELTFRARS